MAGRIGESVLSYQHAYHAGNHADILKHFVLSFVINSLNSKEKPYTVYDTHSGSGLYDLLDNRSIKTEEASLGILKLLKKNDYPEELKSYISLITEYTSENKYPGSPEIEKRLIRTQDNLILSELHPVEFENLSKNIKNGQNASNIQLHKRNGWEMIKALTPPSTKRGCVLIDPSYEETEDYLNAAKTINLIHKKWSNGIIMLWYPLLQHRKNEISQMINSITEESKKLNQNIEIADIQLKVFEEDAHKEVSLQEVLSDKDKKNPPRLYGSGMLVINSPWKLQEICSKVIPYVENILRN